MRNYTEINDVKRVLVDNGYLDCDAENTMGDIASALVAAGNEPSVFAFHDDHLGLESNLTDEFKNLPLECVDKQEHEEDIELILEQANIIIPLLERELSEDDLEDIREDLDSRGMNQNEE